MSIVNLKIICEKAKADTVTRTSNSSRGGTFIYNRNDRFHTRDGLFMRDELSV